MITDRIREVAASARSDVRGPAPSSYRSFVGQRREQTNRRCLLLVHAFIGLFVGTLILFTGVSRTLGSPDTWTRPTAGVTALLGGTLLLIGLVRRPPSLGLQAAGLVVLGLWNLVMATAVLTVTVLADRVHVEWPWVASSTVPTEAIYPVVLYLGLFAMSAVHLMTLRQVRDSERRARRLER